MNKPCPLSNAYLISNLLNLTHTIIEQALQRVNIWRFQR
jgi:hypothetical protein